MGKVSSYPVCPIEGVHGPRRIAHNGRMANRIRSLREQAGWSRKKLAELAGTTPNQLVKLENGDRRLSDHWAERLARPLGVQPYELMLPEGVPVALRMIPMLGAVSCGNWREAVQHAARQVPTLYGGANSFALEPVGDSMNKLLPSGGYIVVDPDQLGLEDHRAYVIMNEDGETTAKLYRSNPPRLEPCSTNPEHETILVGERPFRVVGRVVGAMSSM